MSESITKTQNEEKQVIRLAAQRHLYSKAKTMFAVRATASVLIALFGATFASLWPELRPFVALVALPYSFLDLYLESLQKNWVKCAAKVQEMFDCDVLALRWVNTKYGRAIDEEIIMGWGAKNAKNPNTVSMLTNWYPNAVGDIPIHLGRLICQRANSVWDRKLRESYSEVVLIILILVALIVFFIGLRDARTFEQLVLAVVVPLAPAFLLAIRHFNKLRDANLALEKIASDVESVWEKSLVNPLDKDRATEAARDIQNQIFDNRKNSEVIFDWLYWLLRSQSEQAMQARAEDLADEARKALSR